MYHVCNRNVRQETKSQKRTKNTYVQIRTTIVEFIHKWWIKNRNKSLFPHYFIIFWHNSLTREINLNYFPSYDKLFILNYQCNLLCLRFWICFWTEFVYVSRTILLTVSVVNGIRCLRTHFISACLCLAANGHCAICILFQVETFKQIYWHLFLAHSHTNEH